MLLPLPPPSQNERLIKGALEPIKNVQPLQHKKDVQGFTQNAVYIVYICVLSIKAQVQSKHRND